MTLRSPNEGEILLLQYLVNMTSADDPVLKLYIVDDTIDDTITESALTEATQAGYAPITLTGAGWTTTQAAGLTTAVFSEQTFNFTTSASVYGYYVTDQTQNNILWIERFSGAPFNLPNGGGTIAITPKVTLD